MAPEAALGRVLAAPVAAAVSLPPWDNSAMDGFAIRAADVAEATEDAPVRLTVVGESRAGGAPDARVMPETAVRIATGAPLPQGADAVVPVEDTTPLDAAGRRRARVAARCWARCRPRRSSMPGWARATRSGTLGSDVRAGDVIAPARRPRHAGRRGARVRGRRRPRSPCAAGPIVAVLATGDEVRAPGTDLGPAGIPDANGPGLRALVRDAGAVPLDLGIAVDTLEDVEARLRRGLAEADLVVVSGGVSVGPYDVVRLAFDNVGHMNLWRVAVQPGKPFAFGRADVEGRDRPGAPVRPAGQPGVGVRDLRAVRAARPPAARRPGAPPPAGRPGRARGAGDARASGGAATSGSPPCGTRTGCRSATSKGRVRVRLAGGQGSHVLSALAAADALAVIPEPIETAEAGTRGRDPLARPRLTRTRRIAPR